MAQVDEDEITPEQTETIIHFQDLTGIETMERCREILETHNWDLEVAVQTTLNEQDGAPSVFHQQHQQDERPPQVNNSPSDQRIFTVAHRRPRGILGWGYYIFLMPFRFVYSTFVDLFQFTLRLLRPDPRRNVTDPLGDVVKFISAYNLQFGSNHPVFYQGSYSQALNDAKRELKFLLVYLHGDDHEDTAGFCRATLSNDDVVEFINTSMLFWACNTNSPEGYRVSQALRENTYPFLALIVLRQNKMTVIARIEGPVGPEEFVNKLTRVMNDNEASLLTARAEREERSFNQSLREQQDAAYLESLKADQEKERKKREELEKVEQEEEERRNQEREEQRKKEEIARKKEEYKDKIPAEPESDNPDLVHIVLKLPSGKRIERKFLKTQSIKYLYYFVYCHDDTPDDFQIVTNFPRKVLPCAPSGDDDADPEPETFQQIGLGRSEMLFVHDNDA
ncbi:FAS-associated factor 2-like [Tubulanus polymorphus]|uniref:FAS-associated factor 2-like n=1 Tax=Tubulanus polymorphus TaxID=672921 RepID=UPI003DA40CD8